MKTGWGRINTYFLLAVALLAAVVAGGAGCSAAQKERRQRKFEQSSIRLHLQANPDPGGATTNALVGRATPFEVAIQRNAFLTEFQLDRADLSDTVGGFVIGLQFTPEGAITLEQYTTAYRGRQIVIGAEFGPVRWLAAPVIRQRITDGRLVFTPDTTREEAERIVRGLNRVAELVRKGRK
ncbi:MAG: hypothetical protein RJA22_87 [Verrucomicrobiota bacterium]|jgi:preprotein translocase subunit SecD